ncbi:MAG: hypothetical protein MRJ65_10390 [Candidatus Brocadiaceae bacterium]|nr:hypothetical protein [Candidatus Brocadiaceae bacterium]
MKIEFDPGLIEEVLFKELRLREGEGDLKLSEEYHSLADPIYESFSLDERSPQFRKIEWDFFNKLGFVALIENAFNEYPAFEDVVAGGVIVKAKSKHDEGSNLTKGLDDKKRIKVKLLSERFHDAGYLQKFMRHELMHVSDMLNDAFGYRDEVLGGNPMEQSIITERYSTFWDIFVDSRILKNGKETIGDKDSRYEEFAALYMGFPDESKKAIFETLWGDETLTHGRMLELATDVHKVLEIAHDKMPENLKQKKKVLLPGSLCPLCQFRTYNWVYIDEDSEIVQDVKADVPDWSPEDGACDRCVEMYRSRRAISNQII